MSLINSTASSRLWFCPIKGLDPTRPPIVLLCFGSLIQVYISSQCLTPYVYDSTKELAWGISQGKSWHCALSLRRRMREENKVSCETESRRMDDSFCLTFKSQIGFSILLHIQSENILQCLDICRNCQMEIQV